MALLNLPLLLNGLIGQTPTKTQADQANTLEDSTVNIDVLANDTPSQQGLVNALLSGLLNGNQASQKLTLKSVSVPQGMGTAVIENNRIKYTPPADFHGTVSLSYIASSGNKDSAPTTVTVQVVPVNDAPTTAPVSLAAIVANSGARTITQAELLGQASDLDNDALTASNLSIVAGQGTLVANDDGSWRYTPASGDESDVRFSYSVSDGTLSTTGSATLDITPAPAPAPAPAADITLISTIQGSGEASALVGKAVTVEGRVTAWKPDLKMFFIEEETADRDNNAATSEGIAVFYGAATSPVTLDSIGDIVRLTGTVAEFKATSDTGTGTLTQLTNINGFARITDGTAADLETPTQVKLPIATSTTLERYEGMHIDISAASGKDLFVADTYTFARFGETTLYADAVPLTYTEFNAPSVAGYTAYQDFLSRNSIQLEDGNSAQNPTLAKLNSGSMILRDHTADGVSNASAMGVQADGSVNFIRAGDHTSSVTGVLGYSFGTYELQPTANVNLVAAPRPTGSPDVGAAEVKVASFNVLNYFTTLGTANFTTPAGNSIAGRGANTAAEFTQQQAKIVEAMLATGANVFGINELQNNGDSANSAIASLVNALNAKAGSAKFAYVSGHATGSDAIRVGILYDTTVVKPVGAATTPNTATYDAFASANRLPVAQSFSYLNDDTKQFTVVVNHFKSKGSAASLPGDTDQGDGQGNSAATRLEAAKDLNAWLNTNPTGHGDGNVVLTGDLNAYRMETAVTYLTGQGFVEAANPGDYSYVFDGLRGSLDHVLTRGIGSAEITGTAHFHINADEQVSLDYNDEFGDGSVSKAMDENNMYRSSDHDPVVIGLKLDASSNQTPAPAPAPVPAPSPAPTPAPAPAPEPAPEPAPLNVFISEIHYDNASTDAGEAIGIQGVAGTDLTGWSIVLYNGNAPTAATTYNATGISGAISLSGLVIDNENNSGFGEVFVLAPGLQNGTADGLALVDASGKVVQLLSYEGVFTASNGPAAGMTSVDIGVFEDTNTTPVGASLQLVGGVWQLSTDDSFGTLNIA